MYECIWLNLPLLTFWLIYYPHPPYFIIMTAYSDHRGDHIWSYQWSHHLAFILRHRGWKGQGYPGGAIALHDDTKSSRIVAQLYEFEYFLTFGHPAPGMSPSIESSVVNLFTSVGVVHTSLDYYRPDCPALTSFSWSPMDPCRTSTPGLRSWRRLLDLAPDLRSCRRRFSSVRTTGCDHSQRPVFSYHMEQQSLAWPTSTFSSTIRNVSTYILYRHPLFQLSGNDRVALTTNALPLGLVLVFNPVTSDMTSRLRSALTVVVAHTAILLWSTCFPHLSFDTGAALRNSITEFIWLITLWPCTLINVFKLRLELSFFSFRNTNSRNCFTFFELRTHTVALTFSNITSGKFIYSHPIMQSVVVEHYSSQNSTRLSNHLL
jgi:hypothetical protein